MKRNKWRCVRLLVCFRRSTRRATQCFLGCDNAEFRSARQLRATKNIINIIIIINNIILMFGTCGERINVAAGNIGEPSQFRDPNDDPSKIAAAEKTTFPARSVD